MTTVDPIADMLTRIRNATVVKRRFALIPASRLKEAVSKVLQDEGYIARYEILRDAKFPVLKVYLKYAENGDPVLQGLTRVSKPGCRVYTKRESIPWVRSGLGTVILSTPRGVVTGREARRLNVGGEIMCEVW